MVGSINDIMATAAYLKNPDRARSPASMGPANAALATLQVLHRCSSTLTGKKTGPELVALTCI